MSFNVKSKDLKQLCHDFYLTDGTVLKTSRGSSQVVILHLAQIEISISFLDWLTIFYMIFIFSIIVGLQCDNFFYGQRESLSPTAAMVLKPSQSKSFFVQLISQA